MGNKDGTITLLSFIRACLIQAVTGAWELADLYSVFIALVLGTVAYFIPTVEGKITRLLLIVPLVSLASVALLRLLLSPFLVYRNCDATARKAESELRTIIATHEATIRQRDHSIEILNAKPKRSAAEQADYDTVKKALLLLKDTGVAALRHIRKHGSLTFGMYNPALPPGLNLDKTMWVFNHCVSEGILTCKSNSVNSERTFSVAPTMAKALDELLYDESITGSV